MLFEYLFANAQHDPNRIAIVDDRGQYTTQQLAMTASGIGRFLASQTQRSRVGLFLPTGMGFVAGFYGTLLAGKTVVPINFLLGEREIAHIIKDSEIDTVLSVPPLAAKLAGTPLHVIDMTALPQLIAPAEPQGKSAERKGEPEVALPAPAAGDLAVLMYTSGTSGMPKGVMLTYQNLASDTDSAILHAGLKGEHKFLGILPLFHSTGMLATLLAPTQLGASTVYQARFSPVAVMKAIREHRISIIIAVPSMYAALARMKDAGPDDMKQMYAAISGGEPLPDAVRIAFNAKFNQPIYEGYGLTETIGPIAFNVPGAIRGGSVGQIVPMAEVRITDDNGNALPLTDTGEVWLKGPMIMKGYNNLPKETAEAITPDGFFKTGDLGRFDSDGYLYITGRKKELIIVAGEKAVPREIEDVLLTHPGVAEAAVVGKKDASRGEVVVAFVTLKEGQTTQPEELRDYCRQSGLMQWKCPREITILPELPHSPTGKVLKRVLAEQANAEK